MEQKIYLAATESRILFTYTVQESAVGPVPYIKVFTNTQETYDYMKKILSQDES
jgi:hypothetical protein